MWRRDFWRFWVATRPVVTTTQAVSVQLIVHKRVFVVGYRTRKWVL